MIKFLSDLWNNFKEYIVLVVLVILSLFAISLNDKPSVKNAKALAFGTYATVTSVISNIVDITAIKSENERLRETNAQLMLQVNKLREFGVANQELKGLLGLKDTVKFPIKAASIVSKSISISQGIFTINMGNRDGIKPGMPVINDQGLVGLVYSTSENFSVVRTLKNSALRITVKNERSRADGILKWNGTDLVIIDVPKTYDIKPGDRIITSDLSTIIPVPLPVGIAKELSNVNTGIFNEVKVQPFVNFDKTENVFVIQLLQSKEKNNLELNFYNTK